MKTTRKFSRTSLEKRLAKENIQKDIKKQKSELWENNST